MRAKKKIGGVEIDVIVDTIESVIERDGICHPSQLVEASRSEDSPTHTLFEWDDAKAAEAHRVEQARRVIRLIPDLKSTSENAPPKYVHVQRVTDDGQILDGYTQTVRALRGGTRQAVLMDALRQLKGLQARYEGLSDLAPVWEAIERVEAESEVAAA